jgi:hypothetical protein
MGRFRKRLFSFLLFSLVLTGCAAVLSRPAPPGPPRPPECAAFFHDLDEKVREEGVRNAAAFEVPGFPYLRANRFLKVLGDRVRTDEEKESWAGWMRDLALKGRTAEIRNLTPEAVRSLSGKKGAGEAREELISRVALCADGMRDHDREGGGLHAAVRAAVQIPDEYSTFLRVIGLHPLTAIPVALATERARADFRKWFAGDMEKLPVAGRLKRYFPAGAVSPGPGEIARIIAEAADPFLKVPRPGAPGLEKLARAFAPAVVQDEAGPYDEIGKPAWRGDRIEIAGERPEVYYYFSNAFLNGRPILQVQYVFWYGARAGDSPPWFERGLLDGLTIRFSLDSRGEPFMVDIMNNCGCYHFFAPARGRVNQTLAPASATPPFVPQDLPPLGREERLGVRVNSGRHQVQRLFAAREGKGDILYDLRPYEDLESLPAGDGSRKSLFDASGIVPGTERSERFFLFPMGVPRVGSMRQRGHHAVDFIGRAHFDDPDLFERNFILR